MDFSADWPPGGQVGSCRLEKFQFVKASVSSSSSCVIAASIPLVATKGIDFFFLLWIWILMNGFSLNIILVCIFVIVLNENYILI